MKRSLVLAILFILNPLKTLAADDFDLRRVDHQAHFAVSYGLAMTSTLLFEKHNFSRTESILYGTLITLSTGLAKEYAWDKTASQGDLVADALGTALSAGVIYTFDF